MLHPGLPHGQTLSLGKGSRTAHVKAEAGTPPRSIAFSRTHTYIRGARRSPSHTRPGIRIAVLQEPA
jgi:hypothetical protein